MVNESAVNESAVNESAVKVSVVMPLHNEARFVGEAIASLQAQTVPPHEIVVVDDGSTDGSGAIALGVAGPVPVRVIRVPRAEGSVRARNLGAAEATGDWIAGCDADDLWLPAKLERQLQLLDSWSGSPLVVVSTLGRNITEAGEDFGPCHGSCTSEAAFRARGPDHVIMVPHSSVLYPKELFERVGGYDDSYTGAEDCELWERMVAASDGVAITVPEPLILYRRKIGGMMQTFYWRQQVNLVRIRASRRSLAAGGPPVGYEETEALLAAEPRAQQLRRRARWTSNYFYRFGVANWVNGRRARGAAQLALSGVIQPSRLVDRVRR